MNARFESKPLKLAAKVKTKSDGKEGFVTKIGFLRMRRGGGEKIDVFFPEKQARGFTFMTRKVFMSSFLSFVANVDENVELAANNN
ncbi:MAG TPA: hypothetical protein VFF73_11375 [Planctomycetota bacterium]|jgi:hypothetical protein|nr:hypothetical protein [Planctomycetota bacterium]